MRFGAENLRQTFLSGPSTREGASSSLPLNLSNNQNHQLPAAPRLVRRTWRVFSANGFLSANALCVSGLVLEISRAEEAHCSICLPPDTGLQIFPSCRQISNSPVEGERRGDGTSPDTNHSSIKRLMRSRSFLGILRPERYGWHHDQTQCVQQQRLRRQCDRCPLLLPR